jgi:hypothetical protein
MDGCIVPRVLFRSIFWGLMNSRVVPSYTFYVAKIAGVITILGSLMHKIVIFKTVGFKRGLNFTVNERSNSDKLY